MTVRMAAKSGPSGSSGRGRLASLMNDDTAGTVTFGDLTVRRLGFGAMRITGRGIWGPPPDPDLAIAVLRRAVELGVNLIDTADSYGPEVSEELIAEALHPYPADLVIATKGGLERTGPAAVAGKRPPRLPQGRLRAQPAPAAARHIDVYQQHRPDPDVPYEETIGALAELREAGKIRHVGVSNVSVEQLAVAQAIVPVVSVQNRYNLLDRESEDVLQACAAQGLPFLPWYPLSSGGLQNGALTRVAERRDVTVYQVALAWLLAHDAVIVAIPGTGSLEHLEENVSAAELRLEPEDLAELESAQS